jgi:hypothetical protein
MLIRNVNPELQREIKAIGSFTVDQLQYCFKYMRKDKKQMLKSGEPITAEFENSLIVTRLLYFNRINAWTKQQTCRN